MKIPEFKKSVIGIIAEFCRIPSTFPNKVAKEAAGALGWLNLGKFLGDFAVDCKLLELGEAQAVEAVVPSHEFGLFIGSGKLNVLSFLEGKGGVKGEGPLLNGL